MLAGGGGGGGGEGKKIRRKEETKHEKMRSTSETEMIFVRIISDNKHEHHERD